MWALIRCSTMFLVALLQITSPAQAQGTGVDTQKIQTSLGLTVDVVALPRQIDLPGSFSVALRLSNPTAGKLVLKDFTLRAVEAPTPLEISSNCTTDVPQLQVEPKNSVIVTCDVQTPGYGDSFLGFFGALLSRWSLVTMSPGEYTFVAVVKARGQDENQENFVVESGKTIAVRLTPTVWQAVAGSMLGSLLMVLFWASSPLVQDKIGQACEGETTLQSYRAKLFKAIGLWCGSTTAATIAIFLTFRLKDSTMPFTLSVNDFYGGLVVGLFGVVLTNELGPKLFKAKSER